MQKDEKIAEKDKNESVPFFSYENFRSLFVLILLILMIRWSCVSPYHVPTPSMLPEIHTGDRLLANKLAYGFKIPFTNMQVFKWSQVERGDIIIFKYPKDAEQDYVKRVVAVAGDRIRLVEDVLYINGVPQERKETDERPQGVVVPEGKRLFQENLDGYEHWTLNSAPEKRGPNLANWQQHSDYEVPEDAVFVMGDNRDESSDSRDWGKVPLSFIKGKAVFVLWSMNSKEPGYWPVFRWDRFFKKLK